jgi:hypothetical protein
MEKRFRTTDWAIRFQMHVLWTVIINAVNGWTRVLGHKGELRALLLELSMALVVRGRTDLASARDDLNDCTRGRRQAWSLPAQTTPAPSRAGSSSQGSALASRSGGLRPSPIAARDRVSDRKPRHEAVLYSTRGHKPGYQRSCTICGNDTSFFCSACGPDCPIHPPQLRKHKACECLNAHLNDPSFRKRKSRVGAS